MTYLSAMPTWVDIRDVPVHLYFHKGLNFLTNVTDNFVKIFPNTERCIRHDVAYVLIEVNLQKLLFKKICFKDKNGELTTVSLSYHGCIHNAIYVRCGSHQKGLYDHKNVFILSKKQGTILQSKFKEVGEEVKLTTDVVEESARDMVSKLLSELESSSTFSVP